MDEGKEAQAVERLHWVSAHDSVGQVITRLMGPGHRFSNMWPDTFEIYFDLPSSCGCHSSSRMESA